MCNSRHSTAFMRRFVKWVDVATHPLVFPPVSLSFALFLWATVTRCMLVSVFGAAILTPNSISEASVVPLIQPGNPQSPDTTWENCQQIKGSYTTLLSNNQSKKVHKQCHSSINCALTLPIFGLPLL
jgi:hypothetical protein